MPMIDCPECEDEVSTKAETCPNCGAPVPAYSEDSDGGVQTVEHTSKKYKKHTLIGCGTMLVSAFVLVIAFCAGFSAMETIGSKPDPTKGDVPASMYIVTASVWVSFALFWIGAIWAVIAQVLAWWHHG